MVDDLPVVQAASAVEAGRIEPRSRTLLGNFPQAFSHLGLINAAARIHLALRLRDEGSPRVPEIEIGR